MVGTMVRAETEAGRKWREDTHDPPELDFVPLNTLNPTYSLFLHLTWTTQLQNLGNQLLNPACPNAMSLQTAQPFQIEYRIPVYILGIV